MSKMDAVRAMREARYAEQQARAGKPATGRGATPRAAAPKVAPAAAPAKSSRPAQAPEQVQGEDAEALCGHRNMSGRTCTRERGHAAKSHRYS